MVVRQYFHRDAPDPMLSDAVVLRLARRHHPGASVVSGIDESGGEARVHLIDADLVFEVQRPPQLRSWTSLDKEARFLQQMAAHDPALPGPRVLDYGWDGMAEYTLMTRVAGDAAVRTAIPDEARPETLMELGRVLRRIHQVDSAPLVESGLFPEV